MTREYENPNPEYNHPEYPGRRMIYPGYNMPEDIRRQPRVPSRGIVYPMYPGPRPDVQGMPRRRMAGDHLPPYPPYDYIPNRRYPIYPEDMDPNGYVPRMHTPVSTVDRPVGFAPMESMGNEVHLDEQLAMYIMSRLYYTDRQGHEHTEPKWSVEEIEKATHEWEFPYGTTPWDKWVAFNLFYADTCKVLSSKEALKTGYYFFFHDEDAPQDKIYRYLVGMGILDD